MKFKKGQIVSKEQFLQNSSFTREEYEGLIVSADEKQRCYNFGIQLDENKIMVVDKEVDVSDVEDKVRSLSALIEPIQREYKSGADLQNYVEKH